MRSSVLVGAFLLALPGCFPTMSAPDVVPVSDLAPRVGSGTARDPLFSVVFDRFRDERSSRAVLGQYDRGGKGGFFGTVTIVSDRDITGVFEDLTKDALAQKGILAGPSPFVLSGTIRQVIVGASPDSKTLRAEAFLELRLVDSTSGSRLWQKSFLGSAQGAEAKETLALAFQDLAGALDRDDSLYALRPAFLAAGGKVPEAAAVPSSARAPKPIRSDVDEPPALQAAPDKRRFAVVVGIERYRQGLPRADFAARDARTVTDYLKKLGYPEENIVTLLDDRAAKSDLEKYIEQWLPANAGAGSSVFVYYSGHGAPNLASGDAYLVPYDGDPSFIEATGFSLKRLYASLGRLPSKDVVVAIDSCFSGAGGRSVLARGARPLVNVRAAAVPKGLTVLSASAGEQISMSYDENGHGLFTYYLLKGIKDGGAARAGGELDIPALFSYLKPHVQSVARGKYGTEQTPQLIGATED